MTDLFTKPPAPPPPAPLAKIGPGVRVRVCWWCDSHDKADCQHCHGTGKVLDDENKSSKDS